MISWKGGAGGVGRASPITLESAELIVKILPCFNFHPRKQCVSAEEETSVHAMIPLTSLPAISVNL